TGRKIPTPSASSSRSSASRLTISRPRSPPLPGSREPSRGLRSVPASAVGSSAATSGRGHPGRTRQRLIHPRPGGPVQPVHPHFDREVTLMSIRIPLTLVAGLGLVLSLGGCTRDPNMPKLGKVHGAVTYKGKVVDSGHVVFTPAAGKGGETGQVATGEINSDGT